MLHNNHVIEHHLASANFWFIEAEKALKVSTDAARLYQQWAYEQEDKALAEDQGQDLFVEKGMYCDPCPFH